MAKKPVKGTKAKKAKSKNSPMVTVLSWVLAPIVLLFFYASLIIFAVGMVPTIVAYLIDATRKKYATRTVGYMNFTGCIIISIDMWTGDSSLDTAIDIISDPLNLLLVYGIAAFGWVIYFGTLPVVGVYLAITNDVRLKTQKTRQEDIVKEWGDGVQVLAQEIPADLVDITTAIPSVEQATAPAPQATSNNPETPKTPPPSA